jgi:hypothetical protein
MKTKSTETEIARLGRENETLRMLLRAGCEWDLSLERGTPEEDLVVPDWREEAEKLLGIRGLSR